MTTDDRNRLGDNFAQMVRDEHGDLVSKGDLSDEEAERAAEIYRAWRLFNQTGDDTSLKELGIFADDDEEEEPEVDA